MRIFFPPDWLMITLFCVVWPVFQIGFSKISNKITDSRFDENSRLYKTRKWERGGKFYDDVFKVRLWKKMLPDGAAVFKEGFEKKKLAGLGEEYLRGFIKETCRAEWAHWMQIAPFWVFGLWSPFFVVWIMLAYALALNIPCIIAQRYNRPRLKKLLEAVRAKNEAASRKR